MVRSVRGFSGVQGDPGAGRAGAIGTARDAMRSAYASAGHGGTAGAVASILVPADFAKGRAYASAREAAMMEPDQAVEQAALLGFAAGLGRLALLAGAPAPDAAPNQDDDELCGTIAERLIRSRDRVLQIGLGHFLTSPEKQLQLIWSARWVQLAFPTVEVGAKLAASLIGTSMRGVDPETCRPPWRAFAIRVPAGLLHLQRGSGELDQVHTIQVATDAGQRWAIFVQAGFVSAWVRGLTTQDLLTDARWEDDEENADHSADYNAGIDEIDERNLLMARRLVRSLVIWLADPERRSAARQPPPSPKARRARRARGEAERAFSPDRYVVSAPVQIDCRPHLAAYSCGTARTLHVRSIVRGHFKPRLGARLGRNVWVEPYERGPKDAPLAIRIHVAEEP